MLNFLLPGLVRLFHHKTDRPDPIDGVFAHELFYRNLIGAKLIKKGPLLDGDFKTTVSAIAIAVPTSYFIRKFQRKGFSQFLTGWEAGMDPGIEVLIVVVDTMFYFQP